MLKEQGRVKELEHEEELGVLRNQANQGQSQLRGQVRLGQAVRDTRGDSVSVTERSVGAIVLWSYQWVYQWDLHSPSM